MRKTDDTPHWPNPLKCTWAPDAKVPSPHIHAPLYVFCAPWPPIIVAGGRGCVLCNSISPCRWFFLLSMKTPELMMLCGVIVYV